ncbi:MAG: cysteine synthase family protein [Candidatus Eisenbacteria bacterium]
MRATPADSLVALVGDTPLLDLSLLSPRPGVRILGKCEWFNPGGSVKDRPALWMVRAGEADGRLRPGRTILEATSGNTGIGLAWIGAALGYPVTICLPANASPERRAALLAYGATLVETDPMLGTDGAILEARARAAADPSRVFHPDQYANLANVAAHYETTGPEILAQTGGTVTHLVAGLGTGGTLMGAGRRLREARPGVVCVGVQPDQPLHGLEGLKHMASALVPPIYDPRAVDEQRTVTTEAAQAMCRRVAREAGAWVGVSAGAALVAALEVAQALAKETATIVVVLCDGGARYASERFWQEGA